MGSAIVPSLSEILRMYKDDIMGSLNSHAIAKVESFNPESQTCTAKISYQKTFYETSSTGQKLKKFVDYPLLIDVPVIVIRGGTGALTMPIKKGDDCLILFNDRDLDNWFAGQNSGGVASPRLHSLADGIALVGLSSTSSKIESYDSERVILSNGNTKLALGVKIKLSNNADDLKTILNDLITAIKSITTTNCAVGAPVAISPASITQLTAISTRIGAFLES